MDSYDKLEGRVRRVLEELRKYHETAMDTRESSEASGDYAGSGFFSGEASAYYRAIEMLEDTLGGDEE